MNDLLTLHHNNGILTEMMAISIAGSGKLNTLEIQLALHCTG